MDERIPNFFIVGAAKAGTTSLYKMLQSHPGIYLPYVKEPMFFCKDEYYAQGIDWYVDTFFKESAGYVSRGEATPHYLYWAEKVAPRIATEIRRAGGTAKLIVVLRDPVERAYSWYWNMIKEGLEDLPFAEALKQEQSRLREFSKELMSTGSMRYGYVRGGLYARQIKCFLRFFSKDAMYFLLQEDLRDPSGQALQGLYSFLGVSPANLKEMHDNSAGQPYSRGLHAWLRTPSHFKEILKRLLPISEQARHVAKVFLMERNTKNFAYPAMDPDVAVQLRESFATEVLELQALIQRDLTHWLPASVFSA
ncbi:MAG: sulfotransferase domain-containing protein [Anaerolineales bacterium]|nr:MAG: sulfotransferase domain-containing protein [Anaerolineales bacterium]